MNRRHFLKGILASATASTALVKLAAPGEVEALTLGEGVILGQEHRLPDMTIPELYMRDHRGKFYPIGFITNVEIEAAIDATVRLTGQGIVSPGAFNRVFFESLYDA